MQSIPILEVNAAKASFKRWKVPASCSIAQWAIESEWGRKVTGKNNYFGIKARAGEPHTMCPTHEVINGKRIPVPAPFRDFDSLEAAFDYHAELIATHEVYAHAMSLLPNLTLFVDAMAEHYATDPHYAATVLSVIHSNNLTQYDR